jgi:hypothetical protein
MTVTNLAEFELDLDRFGEELADEVLAAQIAATETAELVFIDATPEDTGDARESITTGATRQDSNRIRQKLESAKPYGVTHAYSPLYYVRFLNDGTVNMAGRHMVERAALAAGADLQERLG